jgi:hypothetical protein
MQPRQYGRVATTFWTGETGRAIKAQGAEASLVALYLTTSPHSNMLGLYYVSPLYIAVETELGIPGASKGLRGCIEAGFCAYDEPSGFVWVYEMAKFQIADALTMTDKRCLGVQRFYDSLPPNPYLGEFYERYREPFKMRSKRESTPPNTSPMQGALKGHTSPIEADSSSSSSSSNRTPKGVNPSVKPARGIKGASKPLRNGHAHRKADAADATASGGSSVSNPPAEPAGNGDSERADTTEAGGKTGSAAGATDAGDGDDDDAADGETVAGVFAYWQKLMRSPRSKLDEKRRRVIRKALGMGYTPHELCQAIRGCAKTPHNMGVNDRNQVFNGIDLIFRNADQIDRFIRNDIAPPVPANAVGMSNEAAAAAYLARDGFTDDGMTIDMEH